MRKLFAVASTTCGFVFVAACGGGTGARGGAASGGGPNQSTVNLNFGGSGHGSTASGAGANSGAHSTPGAGHDGSPVLSVTGVDGGTACVSHSAGAAVGVLDMLIVEDKTGSMKNTAAGGTGGESKWTLITNALSGFVSDPKSAGIGAGIEFFSDNQSSDCDPTTYETPAVPIAPLNGNAAAITKAINATTKTIGGHTPTPIALTGALVYARKWATSHPTHKVIVVLATDGLPNIYADPAGGCAGSGTSGGTSDPTALQETYTAAQQGVSGTPSIPTYVIGVLATTDKGATALANLNDMASAGGTGSAFVVGTSADAEGQFVAAMNAIRSANNVACTIPIPAPPSGEWIDYTKVAVTYASGAGAAKTLPWNASTCGASGGFYYDSDVDPTTILLCPTTCATVQADTAAKLEVLFGCMLPSDGGTTTITPPNADASVPSSCLLDGQSCTTGAECCTKSCNAQGYCGIVIK